MERGGAAIRIRLVKGANLAMERCEAALRGWPQAPYRSKALVDANFKRMLAFGARRENARGAHVGVASHNVFDLALGLASSGSSRAATPLRSWLEQCDDPCRRRPRISRSCRGRSLHP